MASAILFYRTGGTGDISGESDTRRKASGSTYYDPVDLPSAQILTFTFPDNDLEGISEDYSNNIILCRYRQYMQGWVEEKMLRRR